MPISTPDTDSKRLTSRLPPSLAGCTRDDLSRDFDDAWSLYDALFSGVADERSLVVSPDPLRLPLIFYVGHTAAFYMNKLAMAGLVTQTFDEDLAELFAKGVDPERADELPSLQWPSATRVHGYRQRVHETVMSVIDSAAPPDTITDEHPLWALLMAIEHDRIHFETSSMLLRQLPLEQLRAPAGWELAPSSAAAPQTDMLAVSPGPVVLGKPRAFPTFGWDQEYGRLERDVAPFLASRNLISNAEFLAFVRDDGYLREQLWTPEGWAWRCAQSAEHPKFWRRQDDAWIYRGVFHELPLPADWPVEVNWLEAAAYCRWRGPGYRLPSEAEHARLCADAPLVHGDSILSDHYNLGLRHCSPCPVGSCTSGRTPAGFGDPYGNVWQWLQDDFYPLPGYQPHRLYDDFSQPYFDGQHAMLTGGSWASTGTWGSRFFRSWFRRSFFQHSGFRLARSL